jgi:hypothetical protein
MNRPAGNRNEVATVASVGAMSLFAGARLRGLDSLCPTAGVDGDYRSAAGRLLDAHAAGIPELPDQCVHRHAATPYGDPLAIGAGAIAGCVQFFLITNFAWLIAGNTY